MTNDIVGIDADQIAAWLKTLVMPNSTVEMRVVFASASPHVRHYDADNLTMMAKDAIRLSKDAQGTYWLMNPLPVEWCGSPAKDKDIACRRWLLIDFDPKRAGRVSSTDPEKEAAHVKMVEVEGFLAGCGWPVPIIGDSGNGWHLLYRIDLPTDDDGLVRRVLQVLDSKFSDQSVSIDKGVGNASRICKLYGTLVAKGMDVPDRPHRMSKIVKIPESVKVVSTSLLHQLANEVEPATPVATLLETVAIDGEPASRSEAVGQARKYLMKMDPSKSGDNGHAKLLHAASMLVNDFSLTDHEAENLLLANFNPRCEPPWDQREICRKIVEAKKNPPHRPLKGPRGSEGVTVGSPLSDSPDANETTVIVDEPWPDTINAAAFYGVAGEITRKIQPHSESDPVAILIQTLVAAGNVIGRRCYFQVEATRHYSNLFAVIVGSSSTARKGTSGDHVTRLIQKVDEDWFRDRVFSGLVSGEGVIWNVRDPITKQEAIREGGKHGKVTGYQDVIVDEGVGDKRMLAIESEFSSLLKAKSRDTNTLSEVVRQAWDSGRLRTSAKNSPAKATDAHASLIGHITASELRAVSSEVDMLNGFANRFLWCCVRRSQLLPDGGTIHKVNFDSEISKLKGVVNFASVERELVRDRAAAEEWRRLYPALTAERPGAVGAVCNRGAAQVVRLSLLFALLDMSPEITISHLHAAVALWNYCEASVKFVFGHSLGNRTADAILNALKQASVVGMSRTEISNLLRRNKSKAEIDAALQILFSAKLAHRAPHHTDGRAAEVWFATA